MTRFFPWLDRVQSGLIGVRVAKFANQTVKGVLPANRRRHAAALAVIAVAHLSLFAWFSDQRATPATELPVLIQISLEHGGEGGEASRAVEALRTSEAAAKDRPVANEQAATETVENAEEAPDLPEVPAAKKETFESKTQPSETAASAHDVLAQVEAMVGSSAATESAPSFQPALDYSQLVGPNPTTGKGDGGCAIDLAFEALIQSDPKLQASIAAIPREHRSVANAVQLWDGAWTEPGGVEAKEALLSIQNALVDLISSAPDACQQQSMTGLRLIMSDRTVGDPIVLVVGSGEWRWINLCPDGRPAIVRWLSPR